MGHTIKIKIIKDLNMISHEFERLSKQFSVFNSPLAMITENIWRPPTDVYETQDKIIIKMEIAGIKMENFEIKLIGHTLIITGERHDEANEHKTNYKLMEINYGYFEKMIPLPDNIDIENIQGLYDKGFIEIRLPKKIKSDILVNIQFSQGDK
ncbi:MAG: Hsp20/alpha crystallin family protein [Candidatus Firestonebacteria bacterium]|nr:Hsp20/alpha crystallin family protein [Candidatus Firestonebacteria bacterium]